jgi:hypothetical protein
VAAVSLVYLLHHMYVASAVPAMSLFQWLLDLRRRWWRDRFAELDMFPTEVDAEKALGRATEQGPMQKGDYAIVALFILAIVAIIFAVVIIESSVGATWAVLMRIIRWSLPFALTFATVAMLVYVYRRSIRRSLREQLCAIGVPVCIACGYDLRGQADPRCPECGRPFDPTLLRKE